MEKDGHKTPDLLNSYSIKTPTITKWPARVASLHSNVNNISMAVAVNIVSTVLAIAYRFKMKNITSFKTF